MKISWMIADIQNALRSGLVCCEGSHPHDEADMDPGNPGLAVLRVVICVPGN